MYRLWNEIYENIIYTISYTQIYKEHIIDFKVVEFYQVERAAAPTREDFNEMKRDKMSQMLSDINR